MIDCTHFIIDFTNCKFLYIGLLTLKITTWRRPTMCWNENFQSFLVYKHFYVLISHTDVLKTLFSNKYSTYFVDAFKFKIEFEK